MKTKKLPQSAWNDEQAAGSQSQSVNPSDSYYQNCDKQTHTSHASNDDIYKHIGHDSTPYNNTTGKNSPENVFNNDIAATILFTDKATSADIATPYINRSTYKKAADTALVNSVLDDQSASRLYQNHKVCQNQAAKTKLQDKRVSKPVENLAVTVQQPSPFNSANIDANIPERVFMNGLIKHTAIALAIIIPLAAFSAYAAPQTMLTAAPSNLTPQSSTSQTVIEPSTIIYDSASKPTPVDTVDLTQYVGTWYEIGRLPLYFQRKCAGDVTATYTDKADGDGITVLNQCRQADGTMMSAEGLAKAVDSSGSTLKVTFLPSWIRWLPVGRADYWVLARDADYQTALVGTPNKKYLWLLARTPNISQQTYSKYRQIAEQQGYDLGEFTLTPQSTQYVKLVP